MEAQVVTRETKKIETIRYKIVGAIVAVERSVQKGRAKPVVQSFFVSLKELKAAQRAKTLTLPTFDRVKKYYYCDGRDRTAIWDCFRQGAQFYEEWHRMQAAQDALNRIELCDFDSGKLVWLDSDYRMLYGICSNTPVSIPIRVDYIYGSIVDGEYDLHKVMEILGKRDDVEGAEIVKVPYYNASEGHNFAVEFSVQLSQKDCDYVVGRIMGCGKKKVSGLDIVHALVGCFGRQSGMRDILGIRKARLKDSGYDNCCSSYADVAAERV